MRPESGASESWGTPMAGSLRLRPFEPADTDASLSLFRDCVHRVNLGDYTAEQVDAWASAGGDRSAWAARFAGRLAYVVTEGDTLVGFADMTRAGHLDRLFVSAAHQRRGIARRLVTALIDDARRNGIDNVTTDASLTAKPFFETMGFVVVRQQTVRCRGVELINFPMRRTVGLND